MKKLFVFLIIVGVFLLVFSEQVTVLADIFILGDPQIYEVKEGDWLSRVAQQHYNDMHLWRQLALINMAPNPDYILPGEKILLPDSEAMQRLKNARTMSSVSGLMETQMLALREKQQNNELAEKEEQLADAAEPETEPAPVEEAEDEAAGFPWTPFIAIMFIVLGFAGLIITRAIRRRREAKARAGKKSTPARTGASDNGQEKDESRRRRVRKGKQDRKEEMPFA